ncbi:MAG: hypothetical protein QOI93_5099, partial [Rhodospirillaceae bacterium]|nr:hypothetical protein [Rhodospirillaceae bacterium]
MVEDWLRGAVSKLVSDPSCRNPLDKREEARQ